MTLVAGITHGTRYLLNYLMNDAGRLHHINLYYAEFIDEWRWRLDSQVTEAYIHDADYNTFVQRLGKQSGFRWQIHRHKNR